MTSVDISFKMRIKYLMETIFSTIQVLMQFYTYYLPKEGDQLWQPKIVVWNRKNEGHQLYSQH